MERTRRGTVLVLVLGALALIAVITLVYTTVGQGDRRVSAVVVRKDNVQRAVGVVSDYLADVVGRDALSTVVDGQSTTGPILVRENADYPYTDPYVRSLKTGGVLDIQRFDPAGTHTKAWAGAGLDPRLSSDPFLASTEPADLRAPGSGPPTATDLNGWLHTTNIAPDGRPVNLANLRNNFDALSVPPNPPSTATPNSAALVVNGKPTMSYQLTLRDAAGLPTSTLVDGSQANVFNPAHWDSWQVHAFTPAHGPSYFGGSAPNDPTGVSADSPASVWYPPYQWADADGDGMFDSRWSELVDAWDPSSPVSLLQDERYRWFVAARVVDLTGLVNVNTATDFVNPPRDATSASVAPVGLTPGDVDLRRLLTLGDAERRWGFGYDQLTYTASAPYGTTTADDYSGYVGNASLAAGAAAYDSIRKVLVPNDVAAPEFGTVVPSGIFVSPDNRSLYYKQVGAPGGSSYFGSGAFRIGALFGASDLLELMERRATNGNATSRLETIADGRASVATRGPGPLRSNRSAAQERTVDMYTGGGTALANGGMGDGLLDLTAATRFVADVRHLLTTLNGARQFRSRPVTNASVLDRATELRVDAVEALLDVSDLNLLFPFPVPQYTTREPALLFSSYVEALSPHLGEDGYWNTNRQRLRTTAYGYEPELALRTSAFMAANAADAFDKDGHQSGFTLILRGDGGTRTALAGGAGLQDYSFWNMTGAGNPGRLDYDRNLPAGSAPRLADAGDTLAASAVNIFGTEAQPFLVQAVTIEVYTDAPSEHGGDVEPFNPDPAAPPSPITIKGTGAPTPATVPDMNANGDFLGEIIAFQITNPFDADLELTKETGNVPQLIQDDDYSEYYLEFGGSLFKIASMSTDDPSAELEAITLRPHETRVLFATNLDFAFLSRRWDTLGEASGLVGALRDFIDNQLAIEKRPELTYPPDEMMADGVHVKPLRIRRMDPVTGITFEIDPSGAVQDSQTPSFFEDTAKLTAVHLWRAVRNQLDPAGQPNRRENDLLVDRLRDPAASMGQRSTLDRRMPSSNSDIPDTEIPDDDTGYTIALWGSIRRHDDPAGAGTMPVGALPAYCLEPKWFGDGTFRNVNQHDPATGGPPIPDKAKFAAAEGEHRFDDFVNQGTGASGVVVPTIKRRPEKKTGALIPVNLDNLNFKTLYPQVHLNNEEYQRTTASGYDISTLRVADMLLPMGVGAFEQPGAAAPAGLSEEHPEWVTLSESLAMALHYSTPPAADPAYGIYRDFGKKGVGASDRGHLSLERFTPFDDMNGNLVFDPNTDRVRSPGIPLALNVLNTFRTMDPEFTSFTKATPGQINLNTAPDRVLRLMPMLAPTAEVGPSGPIWDTWKDNAGLVGGSTFPAPATSAGGTDGTDVAAAMVAYRDKAIAFDRDQQAANFVDTGGLTGTFDPTNWDGRFLTSQIAGLREQPGFGSLGEIMAIIDRTGPANAPGNSRIGAHDTIDYFSYDGTVTNSRATSFTLYREPTGGREASSIPDDWSEKLLAAGAISTISTVSSDYYAVYFVVQGYQRSDCEDLGPDDPLVPSIAKRFLMILDRSQVTRKGERPRVVLMTELPM
jgi:hypothetical protein